jgi:mono/diheme cytochrome c family protein
MPKQKTVVRALSAAVALLLIAGCRQDMHDQPKFIPQRGTSFFADGRSARPQVENTVGRGQLHANSYLSTGFSGGREGDGMPVPVTAELMERGQERYNIYCTPCHSRVGNGMGMIVQRGYSQAGNLNSPRLQAAPLGHLFNVISNGYGTMPDYSGQVTPVDRWAIVAYIRALQLSQNATQADVPSGMHVESLHTIAEREGLPATFADEWTVPATAANGTPDDQPFVLPGAGSATPPATPAPTPTAKGSTPSATTETEAPRQ